MKYLMIYCAFFIMGILMGYYTSNGAKGSSKNYKLPAALKLQVQEVVNRDLQIRERYHSPVFIHQRNARISKL